MHGGLEYDTVLTQIHDLVDFGIESKETTDKVWAEMCKFKYI